LDDVPAGLSPVPVDHENHDDLMQARATALAKLQVACSRLERASLEQRVATLDARLAHRTPARASTIAS
jgi:hypothetical protein